MYYCMYELTEIMTNIFPFRKSLIFRIILSEKKLQHREIKNYKAGIKYVQ